MREIFSFFISISHLLYLSQTLTTLYLEFNQIGDAGAQAIGRALERNQVSSIFNFFISISHLLYLSQTLTDLDLSSNNIRDAGAQAISQALERNQVR